MLEMEEKSLFVEFMGDSPIIRVLDYLLDWEGLEFSITDVANNSSIGRTTLYRIWDKLIENKMVVPTRNIGSTKLYKFDRNNFFVKKLIEIDRRLVLEELRKRAGKKEQSEYELRPKFIKKIKKLGKEEGIKFKSMKELRVLIENG